MKRPTFANLLGRPPETLLILGAGPKAAAVCAKSKVLRDLGVAAPRTVVFDQYAIAAAWDGNHGYTTGDLSLGTPPEKDIGFPYRHDVDRKEVTSSLFSRFSWMAYLTLHRGKFGDWIDRGRPHPTHREWAAYIEWVIKNSADEINIGTVLELHPEDGGWRLVANCNNKKKDFSGDKLLVTGVGDAKRPSYPVPAGLNVLHGDDFWSNIGLLDRLEFNNEDAFPIVVVGGGETAAAIAGFLAERFPNPPSKIIIVTRSGTIYTRGESYYENRIFTHSDDWSNFPENVRLETIRRGDRGVFSTAIVERLAHAPTVEHQFFVAEGVEVYDPAMRWPRLIGSARSSQGEREDRIDCQLLIFAMGFDPLSFVRLIKDEKMSQALPRTCVGQNNQSMYEVERLIEYDLSVSATVSPSKLYLPMLAGLAQGPGFPNLSCLGLLSDRILGRIKA
jgi:mycobactin lysine-N-oxygenase